MNLIPLVTTHESINNLRQQFGGNCFGFVFVFPPPPNLIAFSCCIVFLFYLADDIVQYHLGQVTSWYDRPLVSNVIDKKKKINKYLFIFFFYERRKGREINRSSYSTTCSLHELTSFLVPCDSLFGGVRGKVRETDRKLGREWLKRNHIYKVFIFIFCCHVAMVTALWWFVSVVGSKLHKLLFFIFFLSKKQLIPLLFRIVV